MCGRSVPGAPFPTHGETAATGYNTAEILRMRQRKTMIDIDWQIA
jgi:hypothetical protein